MVIMIMVVSMVMIMVVFMIMVVIVIMVMIVVMVMVVVMMVIMVMVMFVMVMVIVVMVIVQMPIQVLHVMVMAVMLLIEDHIKIAAVDAGFLHSFDLDPKAAAGDPFENAAQLLLVRAQVQERRNGHISADPCTAFQVQNFFSAHRSDCPPQARRLICVAM